MAANSSSVSGPVFCSTWVGTPSLPTSCSIPANLIASVRSVRGAEGSGTFVVITDFHFNPFEQPELATALAMSAPAAWPATLTSTKDQVMSRTGEDTNHALLASSLVAFAKAAAGADFAIVAGDFLAHEFNEKAS